MSQANVEVVRSNVEAWRREDFEAFLSNAHPAIEWHTALERSVEGIESVYRGHEGVRRLWHDYRTELENFQVEGRPSKPWG